MTILDRQTLFAAVQAAFPAATVQAPWDLRFGRLAHEHIAAVFGAEFATELRVLRGSVQWNVAWDCDKFARHAASLIALKHAIAQGVNTETPEGVAFGALAYLQGGRIGAGHAINVLLTEHGVETWEPQTQQFVHLTNKEKSSAYLVQF